MDYPQAFAFAFVVALSRLSFDLELDNEAVDQASFVSWAACLVVAAVEQTPIEQVVVVVVVVVVALAVALKPFGQRCSSSSFDWAVADSCNAVVVAAVVVAVVAAAVEASFDSLVAYPAGPFPTADSSLAFDDAAVVDRHYTVLVVDLQQCPRRQRVAELLLDLAFLAALTRLAAAFAVVAAAVVVVASAVEVAYDRSQVTSL